MQAKILQAKILFSDQQAKSYSPINPVCVYPTIFLENHSLVCNAHFIVTKLLLCFDCDFLLLSHSPDCGFFVAESPPDCCFVSLFVALLARWSKIRNPQWIVADVQMVTRLWPMLAIFSPGHNRKSHNCSVPCKHSDCVYRNEGLKRSL